MVPSTIRRSRTGFVILLQSAMIDWLSKRQSTVESSVFGAEFCAMKHGIENLRGIRYKLRMMGVPINGPSYIVTNSSRPESTPKKKSNSVCFHAVQEAVAMGECLMAHIPTKQNLAGLFTKILGGIQRRDLVRKLLWYIYDWFVFIIWFAGAFRGRCWGQTNPKRLMTGSRGL